MSRLERTRSEAIDDLGKKTKQSLAIVKLDKDGACIQCDKVELHKDTDLDIFVAQANAYKVENEALEARLKLESENAHKLEVDGLKSAIYKQSIVNAYNVYINECILDGNYPSDLDNLKAWFINYINGITKDIYKDNKRFTELVCLLGGK